MNYFNRIWCQRTVFYHMCWTYGDIIYKKSWNSYISFSKQPTWIPTSFQNIFDRIQPEPQDILNFWAFLSLDILMKCILIKKASIVVLELMLFGTRPQARSWRVNYNFLLKLPICTSPYWLMLAPVQTKSPFRRGFVSYRKTIAECTHFSDNNGVQNSRFSVVN